MQNSTAFSRHIPKSECNASPLSFKSRELILTKASISNSTYQKHPIAVSNISVIFVVFADFLSLSIAKTIATALLSSRLEYCISLLYNTANKDIARLQRVQNCLARVVTRSASFSSSVPLLKSLHLLPVHYRVIFKICTIS